MTIRSLRAAARVLAALTCALVAVWLAGCSPITHEEKTVAIGTFFPTTGANATLGQALQNAVDLAVKQHASLGGGWTLTAAHVDSDGSDPASAAAGFVGDSRVMAVVGPLGSQAAAGIMPLIGQNGLATISPGATLPGLTLADQAAAEGLPFAQLHPQGKPVAFFRLAQTDLAAGKAAADLAVAPAKSHGLEAQSVFVVDDGSAAAKALAAVFGQELKAKGGYVVKQQTLVAQDPDGAQAVVTAIIKANPDVVFYAGDTLTGAQLRGTLSLTGAPMLPMLTTGAIADSASWGAAVGVAAAAANTTAILPAADLSTLPNAKQFIADYQAAYSSVPPPQAALAYDAAMDEIAAIQAQVKAGRAPARADVLAAVASGKYPGVTGTLAFDRNGDSATPVPLSVYICDTQGNWQYQATAGGS